MQKTRKKNPVWKCMFVLVLFTLVQGCARNSLTESWTSDTFVGPIQGTVLVVGAFKEPVAHKIYEDSFVASLKEAGINATASHGYGLGTQPSKEELQRVVAESGATAFVVSYLLSEKTTTTYFPPLAERISTVSYWEGGDDFHTFVYEQQWGADEKTRKVDRIEAVLFDAKSGKHIWSAQVKSINYQDLLREDDEELEELFIKDMRQHNIL